MGSTKVTSTRQRVLIGCLGACTPLVLNLVVVDHGALAGLTLLVFAGYLIRVAGLLFLGSVIGYLHASETNPVKLFQLGMAAPALITGMLNAGNLQKATIAYTPHSGPPMASIFAVSSVHAQTKEPSGRVKKFSVSKESAMQQILRGLTGAKHDRIWFVFASRHRELSDARRRADEVNERKLGFQAEVYAPYGNSNTYSVVIGEKLSLPEARQLREKAVAAGYSDANVWTPSVEQSR